MVSESALLLLLFCLFKLHMMFLEDFKNDYKFWGRESLPKSGLYKQESASIPVKVSYCFSSSTNSLYYLFISTDVDNNNDIHSLHVV